MKKSQIVLLIILIISNVMSINRQKHELKYKRLGGFFGGNDISDDQE